ncbi:conserved hypothetical protein [Leishmania infantum JPCM5]|uniref:Uncharacterized protein n=2 Tax=Leishmania infantum TaxID=5671 RepID=A4IBN8_LEIIN|nr:conserved hypothetical protein [Leishmania infantum JPCM5]CAC9545976.1 hypothetical_protein_-_conserved [Leishmania infantum]CAM72258.1 conserved hypothetical protein [Leishmania infantum JPCM5]SUZ46178.1 hypothetical_protein_-_conserved [Leishmania infantum]|eukprot:XP_001469157.1 conserved hypothetical protein [Leishmania infantum JPCM5]
MQSYRLEVAVKRVYGLDPLIASVASTISVEVRFLDFPPIVIHPQGYAIGDSVTYNICHKADFRMSSEQAVAVFPAMCQCQLVSVKEGAVVGAARWSCPCPLVPQPDAAAQPPLRTYADYVIGNAAGETVGYADMSCRVLSQDAPAPRASVMPLPIAAPPVRDAEPSRETGAEQGKPYIVRVVVGESDRHRRPSQPPRCEGVQDASRGHEATAARASVSDRGQPPRRVPANTAEKSSLLHLLQYDVAYQLQSLSETVAAALHREHDVLTRTPLKGPDKSGAVSTSRLTKSIDNHVASIVRVANIILQVANQLVDNSPAPPRIGTSREVKDMIRQWRNPVNKLPLPAEGSVGHYLQYDVLYQLQCLGTNLAYMIVAYRAALDTPLSSIPAQHVEYCDELGHEIQHLTKHINILVQSSVDGTLSTAAPSIVPEPVAHDKHRKRSKGNSQSTPPAAGPQLAPPKFTGAAKSLSRTSYSSFSSTRSASSSSLSSSSLSSSLNRPPARGSPPQAPTVVTVPATPPPAVSSQQAAAPAPNATSQPLPPPPSYNAAAATTSSQQTSPPLPTQPPPPYTVAAPSAQSTATPLPTPAKSRTGLSPSNSIESFSAPTVPSQANQLVSPVSWINQESNYQSPPVATSPPSLHTALQSTGIYGTASSTFAPQPVLATGGPPVLHPPYLSSVPPPLATPTPLAPPSAAPSPPPMAAPKLATQLPIQPQPQAPLAIPIPVPIPR